MPTISFTFFHLLCNVVACSLIVGAQESLDEKVVLKPCDSYPLHTLKGPHEYNAVANSTEALQAVEDCVAVWVKQIEQVVFVCVCVCVCVFV